MKPKHQGPSRASGIMRGMSAPNPRRCNLRFAIVGVVCLLLGAAMTVGMAWGCAMPSARERWRNPMGVSGAREWEIARERDDLGCYTRIELRFEQPHERFLLEAGWPARALRSNLAWGFASPDFSDWEFLSWTEGVTVPTGAQRGGRFTLPVQLIWPGFAIDTALYATVWYLLFFAPLPLYRAGPRCLRVSKGLCPACAYDLEGAPNGPARGAGGRDDHPA